MLEIEANYTETPTPTPTPVDPSEPTAAETEPVLQLETAADSEFDPTGTCMEDVLLQLAGIGLGHALGTNDAAVNDQWVAGYEDCVDQLAADGLLSDDLLSESRGQGRAILEEYIAEVEASITEAGPVSMTNGIGDTVRLGDMDVTLNGVRADSGTEYFEPDEGHAFVYVDVSFQNHGGEPAPLSTFLQMELRDADGWSYSIDLSATAAGDKPSPDGEVGPGQMRRGEVGYQVPVGATGLTWAFSGDLFSTREAVFELGEIPGLGPLEGAN